MTRKSTLSFAGKHVVVHVRIINGRIALGKALRSESNMRHALRVMTGYQPSWDYAHSARWGK